MHFFLNDLIVGALGQSSWILCGSLKDSTAGSAGWQRSCKHRSLHNAENFLLETWDDFFWSIRETGICDWGIGFFQKLSDICAYGVQSHSQHPQVHAHSPISLSLPYQSFDQVRRYTLQWDSFRKALGAYSSFDVEMSCFIAACIMNLGKKRHNGNW